MPKFKYFLLLLAVVFSLVTFDFASTKAQVSSFDRYILPGDTVFPEGVAYQPSTNNFFVSSTTDGTIFRGNQAQESAEVFLIGGADGRTTAVGLKVDDEKGRLFVAGGATGQIFVYDTHNGELLAKFSNNKTPTFINDVAIAPNGDAYFTDSNNPILYRVFTNEANEIEFEAWLDFTGTSLQYLPGFNLNGIAASNDGKYLVVIQSNTGKLFRIDIASKEVSEIDLGGETLNNGDGILLSDKRTLYVVRNQQQLIVKVKLSKDFTRGKVVSSTTDPSFARPTTIAQAGERLLVVNSQFDRRGSGLTPDLPFTVSAISLP
ncbi:SMP-30/gluconolactonase/LRE family protein [Iningainema tapete]|uniref:SMP-30/gluconolactonase/LRE family protein n=1 Tax=Iningainema tapete BLCC-T55 TaxID=2748662 RepID=A0A8J6XSS5_9CYAN|nr:SMP-30/gluconolactonase/LRE family protein [Iningainema tapete]MBD2778526.1 SMP-30/gluconolactonase/LRE family protein [Iningainema tapete BLCC-T55]